VAAIPQAQPELSEIRNEPPLPRTPEADSPVAPLEALAPPEQQPDPQRFRVAEAAPPAPSMPVQELRSSRGRQEGGTFNSGFTSFEANKHELGEYMLHVRSLVEREWRLALRLRYTGVSRTDAVIECSIRPDGTLEYARVLEPGTSLTFAVLCRQAIEQAAPFGPFPFEVPEIYRKENLEITWRFSYL
jgi:outer membrane biosynthesis protein TonB